MAVVAAQTIAWGTPSLMPQSQAVSFPTVSMTVTPALMERVIPAPYVYNLVPPATPIEAEMLILNESAVQILSL